MSAITEKTTGELRSYHEVVELETRERFQFVDLTETVAERVRRSGVGNGQVNVQTLHTTTAIIVNESEPRLLQDFKELLRRLAPTDAPYRHNDLEARGYGSSPEEKPNGHSHARALVLGTSETLNIGSGRLRLGRWQSVFLVELDGSRRRSVSISILGIGDRR